MADALVSDQHLHGPDDPRQGRFLRWLASLEADRLFVLGDLFEFYWKHPTPGQLPVVQALLAFPGELVLLRGNHDFTPCDRLAVFTHDRWEGDIAGERTLLVHGDEADPALGYRALKAVVRSPLAQRAPSSWAHRVAAKAGPASREHGMNPGLLDQQRRWAQAQPHPRVIMGHSHQRTMESGFVVLGVDTWLEADEGLRFREF